MKKALALLAVVALFSIAPLIGYADSPGDPTYVPDAEECASQAAPGSVTVAAGEADRSALCVSDGDSTNGAELYAGGEAQADTAANQGTGGACGALVVAGVSPPMAGDPNWHQDHVHDPTPDQPNSGDETTHHHDCE